MNSILKFSHLTKALLIVFLLLGFTVVSAQPGWKVCNAPLSNYRIDDIYMSNERVGYAVSGNGKIVKSTDGGENWSLLLHDSTAYCRSVEFIDTLTGFVGGFSRSTPRSNVLRKTTDGGLTWTDITSLIDPRAQGGICGLAIPDQNTIYAGGNWYQDTGYIIKSTDRGATWSFIDMSSYASSIIDMYFLSKDTGFVVGKGPLPNEAGIILYTTDGGLTWSNKFQSPTSNSYCWKIQRLNKNVWFASIEDVGIAPAKMVKSINGGMNWNIVVVSPSPYYVEGIGFMDEQKGWVGGDHIFTYQTVNGGLSWTRVNICPFMNRVFRVNDTFLLASGDRIWKYTDTLKTPPPPVEQVNFTSLKCIPNPANSHTTIEVKLQFTTQVLLMVFDNSGKRLKTLENRLHNRGTHTYDLRTAGFSSGIYYIILKTHEDKKQVKLVVTH